MTLLQQIVVSAGTVITLLLGFWAISAKIKKDSKKAIKSVEISFEQKLTNRDAQIKLDRMDSEATQKELCKSQCGTISDIKESLEKFEAKQIRQAEMQFLCHFTQLEALDKIANKQPINGEIKKRLADLKEFTIKETTS
jgi:hypothetical protein